MGLFWKSERDKRIEAERKKKAENELRLKPLREFAAASQLDACLLGHGSPAGNANEKWLQQIFDCVKTLRQAFPEWCSWSLNPQASLPAYPEWDKIPSHAREALIGIFEDVWIVPGIMETELSSIIKAKIKIFVAGGVADDGSHCLVSNLPEFPALLLLAFDYYLATGSFSSIWPAKSIHLRFFDLNLPFWAQLCFYELCPPDSALYGGRTPSRAKGRIVRWYVEACSC